MKILKNFPRRIRSGRHRGLDILLREETGLPITIAEDPLSAVVLGTGHLLSELELLRDVSI